MAVTAVFFKGGIYIVAWDNTNQDNFPNKRGRETWITVWSSELITKKTKVPSLSVAEPETDVHSAFPRCVCTYIAFILDVCVSNGAKSMVKTTRISSSFQT